jgi:hypothetical protein
VLWTLMACFVLSRAISMRPRRVHLLMAAVTFLVFAGSELVEMKTGAWWRPVWLMVWKGACIAILVSIGIGDFCWHRTTIDIRDAGPENAEDAMLPRL